MIVVDTSLIAYLVIRGNRTAEARSVFRKDPDWAAPILWRSEFRNVLALYLRKGHLKLAEVLRLAEAAEELMHGGEFEVRSADVLRLASTSQCSAYDCEFVALAESLHVPLVTTDRRILRGFPAVAVSPKDFLGAPTQ